MLSPLLFSLFTRDCAATHSSNLLVKFADDTTIVGLISDSDESAYREEVDTLTSWCQVNNLFLNVSNTKEMILDYRRRQEEEHAPLHIKRLSSVVLLLTFWQAKPKNSVSHSKTGLLFLSKGH